MLKKISLFLFFIILFPSLAQADSLSGRLSGKILLQVEANGEAWYIYPKNQNRFFLGRPDDAFQVMRQLGLGITNADFAKFENNMPDRLKGLILIKVQDAGKAFYINPDNKKAYYLGRPADAFRVMRELGLGITTASLNSINEDQSSKTRRQTREQSGNQNNGQGQNPPADDDSDDETGQTPDTDDSDSSNGDTATPDDSEQATTSDESIPDTQASSTALNDCQFQADFWNKEIISGLPYYSTTTTGINLNWGADAPAGLDAFYDKFSARFIGNCQFDGGKYKFTTVYDDGIKATLGDWWLFNDWDDNGYVTNSAYELDVPAGIYQVKVDYFDHRGDAQVFLDWELIE